MEQSGNLGAVHSPATADENGERFGDFSSPRLPDGDCAAPEVACKTQGGNHKNQ